MELSDRGLADREKWEEKGYALPKFNRREMIEKTKENPTWIHFGAGNLFRAFQAKLAQQLLDEEAMETGIVVMEGFDGEIVDKINRPFDEWSILVTLKTDGCMEKTVIGSIAESLILDKSATKDRERAAEIFRKSSLQFAGFTITEKGYQIRQEDGSFFPQIADDMKKEPKEAVSYMGKVTALLYERFLSGEQKMAMVSMDNCSHNGDRLKEAVAAFAKEWEKNGLVQKGFAAYVEDKDNVSFPWTMIDKITPRPDKRVEEILRKDGLEKVSTVVTAKKTYTAPFVNAEECEYLVIENSFPNGRPPLEQAGVFFTDRETVEKAERMKVCTCLNPLHTALAIFGCLLGYDSISEEMKNPVLRRMAERLGLEEGLPVVEHPKILEPKKFLEEVLESRLPNPFIPDTPQRIATDTSKKLAIRFGETIKAYERNENLRTEKLVMIPLVLAGWLRYLTAVDDKGEPFTLSPDPVLRELSAFIEKIKSGNTEERHESIRGVLQMDSIFGVNLYQTGLGERIELYLLEMLEGVGAVRKTLERYV